jgi:Arc/MetJ-type ribon-helix-helix transcriptional regulator
MEKQDSRTALRLSSEQRRQIDDLVKAGKFRNISQVIRTALQEFLKNT